MGLSLGTWACEHLGWESQGSRFSLLQFVGYRGENLFGLPSPPSGPPFLPGGKLGPRESEAPTPTMPASLTGGGPAINRARNVGGVQRSRGGGHGSFPFASIQLATQNTSCCSRLTPKLPQRTPRVEYLG